MRINSNTPPPQHLASYTRPQPHRQANAVQLEHRRKNTSRKASAGCQCTTPHTINFSLSHPWNRKIRAVSSPLLSPLFIPDWVPWLKAKKASSFQKISQFRPRKFFICSLSYHYFTVVLSCCPLTPNSRPVKSLSFDSSPAWDGNLSLSKVK